MPEREFGDDCVYCGCYFISESDLRNHINAAHSAERTAKAEKKIEQMIQEKSKKEAIKVQKCSECSRRLAVSELKQHMLADHFIVV